MSEGMADATTVPDPRPGAPAAGLGPSQLQQLRALGGWRSTLALLGPAFVAAVAYVDPGNFATNIAGGAKYGYLLLWVILGANLMAMPTLADRYWINIAIRLAPRITQSSR